MRIPVLRVFDYKEGQAVTKRERNENTRITGI